MERLPENILNSENKQPFLNEWDKTYLEKGTLGMVQKMYTDFGNKFPDVILFPERGARPLYYFLSPIFIQLNKKQNTNIPKFAYFSVGKRPGNNMLMHEENNDIKTSNDLKQILIDEYHPDLSMEQIERIVNREEVEKVVVAREKMKERAVEITEKTGNDLRLAIVDEVLSNGVTIGEIKKAFDNIEIPAYTIVSLADGNTSMAEPGYRFDEWDDKKNPTIDGYSFSFEHAEDAIGVTKSFDQKYISPIKKDDSSENEKLGRDKKQLREEMKKLGEELASKIMLKPL